MLRVLCLAIQRRAEIRNPRIEVAIDIVESESLRLTCVTSTVRFEYRIVQRDDAFARLVLAGPDVNDALRTKEVTLIDQSVTIGVKLRPESKQQRSVESDDVWRDIT